MGDNLICFSIDKELIEIDFVRGNLAKNIVLTIATLVKLNLDYDGCLILFGVLCTDSTRADYVQEIARQNTILRTQQADLDTANRSRSRILEIGRQNACTNLPL